MRIALVADVFPPLRSSGAVQLRDLAIEFARQDIDLTVFIANPEQDQAVVQEDFHGAKLIRLKTPPTRDRSYVRRTVGELSMPFVMRRHLQKAEIPLDTFDGVVWYSPTIFLGPLVQYLKKKSRCKSYLIIRDIFPEWALDMGLLKRGPVYGFFKSIANYQYRVADTIGVQTPGNLAYFKHWQAKGKQVEVLHNWLHQNPDQGCSINLKQSPLAGRTLFVYAGNMGIAQGMGLLLELADSLIANKQIGFVFVGRGSDAEALKKEAALRNLDNVLFYPEIPPEEIPGLYEQCHIGLVSLDLKHKTHNIPGKFISYMRCGLPVLASVNPGNDLIKLVEEHQVGFACSDGSVENISLAAQNLLLSLEESGHYEERCQALADKLFNPATIVRQILGSLRA